jgi:DNA modification methylase
MKTQHRVHTADARDLYALPAASVELVLTSPPYPMVAMWDAAFSGMSPAVAAALAEQDAAAAFEAMHLELDRVWAHCARVLTTGGWMAINIGDATRTMAGRFQLHSNHARVIQAMQALGMQAMPDILWRKPTNGPTKFMGSGMLPAGAYVTYEHEYILLFRKGGKRTFSRAEDKARRRRSAIFWEERNRWFSDLWTDIRGTTQGLDSAARSRSAAFPVEIPWRLIHMYSCQGDTVLDPFAGTGTTLLAAAAAGRNSIGVELSGDLLAVVDGTMAASVLTGQALVSTRLTAHRAFVASRLIANKGLKHTNGPHGFPVMTSQEADLLLPTPTAVHNEGPGSWSVHLEDATD